MEDFVPRTVSVQRLKGKHAETTSPDPDPLPAEFFKGDDEVWKKILAPSDHDEIEDETASRLIRACVIQRRLDDEGSGNILIQPQPLRVRRNEWIEHEAVRAVPSQPASMAIRP